MGKLQISSSASGKYRCDTVKIKAAFLQYANSSSKALSAILNQCEQFLKTLEHSGIPPQMISIHDDCVEEDRYNEGTPWKAVRAIEMKMRYDPVTINNLLDILKDRENTEIDSEYLVQDTVQIEKELLGQAIEKAKAKAESASKALGRRIIGLEKIEVEPNYIKNSTDWMECEQERGFVLSEESSFERSDRLNAPEVTYSQSVLITFLTD